MDARTAIPTDVNSNRFLDIVKRYLRYRHKLKIIFYGLFCRDEDVTDIPDVIERLSKISESSVQNFPEIKAYGSSAVIQRANLIKTQASVSRYLYCAKNAHIVGNYGLILDRRRRLITHRIGGVERTALRASEFIWRSLRTSFTKPEKHYLAVYTTHCLNTSNYYHWIIEFLAGLAGYEAARENYGGDLPIILQAPYMKRQRDWLDLVGYEYIELKAEQSTHITASTVYFSSNEYSTYCNLDVSTARWVSNRLLNHFQSSSVGQPLHKKIYVNRKDSQKSRGIKNANDIEAFLKKQGFVSISISDYDVESQIALFKNAEIIVSEHGAALANIIFSQNCHLVEIFPCDYFNNDIAVLAMHNDNKYTPVFAYDYEDRHYPNMIKLESLTEAIFT